MPWYFLFSSYSTRSQTKQFCSIYSSFHGTWGHAQFEKRSRKPSVKCWNFTYSERRKRQNKYTRLELKYYCWYCWVAFTYAPSFYFHLEMYRLRSILRPIKFGYFKGRDRENLSMTLLGQLKFEGSVLFEKMKCLISDGMNENKAFMSRF